MTEPIGNKLSIGGDGAVTEQEQRIRWMIKQDKEREFHPNVNDDIRFLIGEIDRLREERETLIEGMRWYAEGNHYFFDMDAGERIADDDGTRARDILKSIGIDV